LAIRPVGDVADRGQRVAADALELVGRGEDDAVQGDADEHAAQRGEEPAGPAGPEAAEGDLVAGRALGEQEGRDQEAREHEEEVDAEVSTGQMTAVEQQHPGHRRAPQAVEGRHVGDAHAP
jgi:hypothetical protein